IMPQTREHLDILTLMGVRRGLVALTKIDIVEAARVEEVRAQVREFVSGTFLESAPICPVSNLTGQGFDAFYDALEAEVEACEGRSCSGLFRTWIADAFTIKGFGTVVTGIPSSGRVALGDQVFVIPGGEKGRVRRLEVYGEDAAEGRAGECVAMNVPELDYTQIKRGMVLTCSDAVAPVTMIEGHLRLLRSFKGELKDNTELHLHLGTASVLARVAFLEREKMVADDSQMVQLRMTEPLGVVPGDRFVIRSSMAGTPEGRLVTIGGGRILSVTNAKLRRRRPWTISTLVMRSAALDDAPAWTEQVLRESDRPLSVSEWARRAFQSEHETSAIVETLCKDGRVVRSAAGTYVHVEQIELASKGIISVLDMLHSENPKRAGFSLQEVSQAMVVIGQPGTGIVAELGLARTPVARPAGVGYVSAKRALSQDIFMVAVEKLAERGVLERRGDLIARA
ncbi:MAG: hypothetical protein N3G20_00330, partial [Verrucomicrobiae bacterium]|nr:hypothetical protein [Verrucomicrobiae bacterium]